MVVASGAIAGAFLVSSSAVRPSTMSPSRFSNEKPAFSTLSSTLLTDPRTLPIADSKVSLIPVMYVFTEVGVNGINPAWRETRNL
ncbi:hypothetical protein EDB83DRAFT_2356350, partial [Lactarius deliciosus]